MNKGNTLLATVMCLAVAGAAFGESCCFSNGNACMNLTPVNCLAAGGLPGYTGSACATTECVWEDISVDTVWPANKVYNLTKQIYVLPGASLTINAGTVVASSTTANGGGALAVSRGARIYANGTVDSPVVMTSTADVNTWSGLTPGGLPDPSSSGTWRAAANEWGNLTIMGRAYTSGSAVDAETCSNTNLQPMEGLVAEQGEEGNVLYGGGDDDDNSGVLHYLSIRYGGRVVGVGNELNGLSLGGIGRATDIKNVEIMNNVDDGIEIWGGTVNLKQVSIWNIGDDSFDVDQGWRGKAQFGLIVQGWSINAAQGSGIGDNVFETDGAEEADWQPLTTATIYNFTAIGQPAAGDYATAFRDNARVQYRNCIFMDMGDEVVRQDSGDNCTTGQGYGFGCTLNWATTWTTAWSFSMAQACNDCANPADRYQAQVDGRLAEVTDSVFFRNLKGGGTGLITDPAYATANAVGVFNAGNNNIFIPGFANADSPVVSVTRSVPGDVGFLNSAIGVITNVKLLDPRAANEAETSVATAPDDGFYCPAQYRGGFSPDENWLIGWSAADAYGMLVNAPYGKCEPPVQPCDGDTNGDGFVNVIDMTNVILLWGTNGQAPLVDADLDNNGVVNVADLTIVILNWGTCD